MNPIGITLIALALCVNAYHFFTLDNSQTIAVLSQCFGAASLILMAFTQIIATRLPIIERIFGALDQSYRLHKWLGVAAVVTFYLHDTLDAKIENISKNGLHDFAKFLGEQGLNGITALTIVSVLLFIPYHWWRWTHRLMGVFFAFSAVHYLLITKPFSVFSPVGTLVTVFCLLGLLAFVYTQLPRKFRTWKRYRISQIEKINDTTVITLSPDTQTIYHQAGQFAFLRFNDAKSKEAHPFTISSAPNSDGTLRFSVKSLGNYTAKLPNSINVGDTADIQGAYGRFIRHSTRKTEIWIAGGIGITPFAAWAEAFTDNDPATVHLFYCVKNLADALHLTALEAAAERYDNFHLHLIESSMMPHLSGQHIADTVGNLSKAKAYFCGPIPMRKKLGTQLRERGISARRYHYEAFEMRTGIGVEGLLRQLSKRIGINIEAKIQQLLQHLPFN